MHKLSFCLLMGSFIMLTTCGKGQSNQNGRKIATEHTEQPADSTDSGNGLIKVASQHSVDATYQKLVKAIKGNKALSIIAELDHQKNAASVGMNLRPTRILMFGNPRLGTPLMQASQTTGLDLPQKMLVYEAENGDVFVAYNDPFYIAERHDITGQKEVLDKISHALQKVAEGAAK